MLSPTGGSKFFSRAPLACSPTLHSPLKSKLVLLARIWLGLASKFRNSVLNELGTAVTYAPGWETTEVTDSKLITIPPFFWLRRGLAIRKRRYIAQCISAVNFNGHYSIPRVTLTGTPPSIWRIISPFARASKPCCYVCASGSANDRQLFAVEASGSN
jgi:hypothetical protein